MTNEVFKLTYGPITRIALDKDVLVFVGPVIKTEIGATADDGEVLLGYEATIRIEDRAATVRLDLETTRKLLKAFGGTSNEF